jgi:arabinofuranosyltransferase
VPALAWTLFALVYYGFPFPNTAYAKLATGIPTAERWRQGVLYLFDSVDRDPLTLAVVALAVVAGFVERSAAGRALATGILLSLAYVVSVGGDFMAGRFVVGAFVVAVLLLTRLATAPTAAWVTLTLVLVGLGATASQVPLLSDSRFDDKGVKPNGVVDERAMYFATRSLARASRTTFEEPDWPRNRGPWPARFNVLDTCGLLGDGGLGWGPYTHMLDTCGLADPLIARLPAVFNPNWRVGHYRRMIPVAYADSLATSDNRLADPRLRQYYEHLRLITRGRPLLSGTRLRAIWLMNTGAYDHLVDRRYYRHHGSVATLADVAGVKDDGTPRDAAGVHDLSALPLAVTCDARSGRRALDVSLDSDDRYILTFLRDGARLGTLELGPIPEYRRQPGLVSYTVDVPPRASERGFDTIVVTGARGDGKFALGHLLLDGTPATDPELHRRLAKRDGLAR